jgi:UDP-MurNAc hydroxylase
MKVVTIGHACWLVETPDSKILFDPLLYDPNQADCYENHPTRRLDIERLHGIDVIAVSHRHIDHFDVRSLCALPRMADVLCPPDSLITRTLESIGFSRLDVLADWKSLHYGKTTIVPTPSLNPIPEFGFVISDGTSTIWNQVDTQVAPETAADVYRRFGRLDIVIAPWQPLLELKFQLNEGTAFPHQSYAELLARARNCESRALIPGASGFRYGSRSAWLNRISFPVSRDRFLDDLQHGSPEGSTTFFKVDPGDEVVCDGSELCIHPQQSCFVSSFEDQDSLIAFCPVDPFQNLFRDSQALSVDECGMSAVIDDLDEFVQRGIGDKASLLSAYGKWRVLYQLIVCFQAGNLFVYWNFGQNATRVDGRSTRPTATAIISGSVLKALARGEYSWEEAYHSGSWRFFQSVALALPENYQVPNSDEIVDILQLRYPYHECLERFISSEIQRWAHPG